MGYLKVVIPPDILSEESSEDGVALEGGTVQMKCKATGLPEPSVVWRREDSKNIILRADGSRDKQGKTAHFLFINSMHLYTDTFSTACLSFCDANAKKAKTRDRLGLFLLFCLNLF